MEDLEAEQIEGRAPIAVPFDPLNPIHVAFNATRVPLHAQPRRHRVEVLADAVDQAFQRREPVASAWSSQAGNRCPSRSAIIFAKDSTQAATASNSGQRASSFFSRRVACSSRWSGWLVISWVARRTLSCLVTLGAGFPSARTACR